MVWRWSNFLIITVFLSQSGLAQLSLVGDWSTDVLMTDQPRGSDWSFSGVSWLEFGNRQCKCSIRIPWKLNISFRKVCIFCPDALAQILNLAYETPKQQPSSLDVYSKNFTDVGWEFFLGTLHHFNGNLDIVLMY